MLISMLVKKKMGQKPFFVTLKQGSEVDKASSISRTNIERFHPATQFMKSVPKNNAKKGIFENLEKITMSQKMLKRRLKGSVEPKKPANKKGSLLSRSSEHQLPSYTHYKSG